MSLSLVVVLIDTEDSVMSHSFTFFPWDAMFLRSTHDAMVAILLMDSHYCMLLPGIYLL